MYWPVNRGRLSPSSLVPVTLQAMAARLAIGLAVLCVAAPASAQDAAGSNPAATAIDGPAPMTPAADLSAAEPNGAEVDTSDQRTRLTVDLAGAGAFTSLLRDFLDITRHANDADLSEREAERLIAITPTQIRELLATAGYFSPTIVPSVQRAPGTLAARFSIDPGEPTKVDQVDLVFQGAIATGPAADAERIARIKERWSLRSGDVFRQESWDAAKGAVLKDLLTRVFPGARIIDSKAIIDPATRRARLSATIDSGPVFTFGPLQIEGLKRYPRTLVDPLNPIAPGEVYSQEKLNELQSQLQDTGYFKSVFATIEIDPAHPVDVPVRVDLNENERKRLSLGVGFSTDSGARAQIKWLDRQLFGRNWRLDSELKVDRLTRLLGGDVTFPALDNGWRPSAGAHYERSDIVGENSDKLNLGAHLASANRHDEQVWGLAYFGDKQRVANVVVNHRQALVASWVYTRRRLDNLLSPQRGYQATLEIDAGPPVLINQKTLLRATGRWTWLAEPSRRWQTVLRAQVGEVRGEARQSVPGDLLFRTGGDQSVRGYAFNSLGVMEDGAVVGGRVFGLASAELVYRITPEWGAAVFHDAGNTADAWRDWHPVHGSGIGGRWRSPIGPVNLDLAYGHAIRKPRLHFSVGYAF